MEPATYQASSQQKVTINPFTHMLNGTKNAFKTNAATMAIAFVLSLVVSLVLVLVAYRFVLVDFIGPNGQISTSHDMTKLIVSLVIFVLLAVAVSSYFSQVMNRVLLTGVRQQHTSTQAALSFALSRFGLTVLCFVLILGCVTVAAIVIALATAAAPFLGVVLAIAAAIIGIIAIVRCIFITLITIDDTRPASAKAVFQRSNALWKKSKAATLMYIVVAIVLLFAVNAASGGNTNHAASYTSSTGSTSVRTTSSTPGSIVASILSAALTVILTAGLVEIYCDAVRLAAKPPANTSQ